MRLPVQQQRPAVRFNMTPMIDVVFLLIIFFLVSSHLARQEVQMELPLPEARTGEKTPVVEVPRVTVNVLPDGTILWGRQPVTPEQLEARLAERLARDGPGLQVRVRGDRHAPYRTVEPVLLACARAGVWDVAFAVFPAGGR